MKKTIKKLALILLTAALMLTVTGCGANDYQTAVQLMGSGDAAAASAAFKALGDYKDSAALASACDYSIATDAYLAEDYEQARALFAALGDYKESASLVTACDYAIAQNTYDAGEYAHAAELFTALGDYKNSAALAAQAGDRVFAEKLLGSWVSNEMDVSSIFIDSLYDAIDDDESSKALLDCMELGALPLKYTIEFTGEGTFLLAADSESAAATRSIQLLRTVSPPIWKKRSSRTLRTTAIPWKDLCRLTAAQRRANSLMPCWKCLWKTLWPACFPRRL